MIVPEIMTMMMIYTVRMNQKKEENCLTLIWLIVVLYYYDDDYYDYGRREEEAFSLSVSSSSLPHTHTKPF